MQGLESLKHLTDQELLEHADGSALGESQSKARLVASLAEIDRRRLYLGVGYTSLFAFCTERLHLTEHEALNRIEAARAAVVFPVILKRLAEGELNLTAIRLLRPLLTPENHVELLDSARHMGKQQILELIARVRPQRPVPPTIRKLPKPRGTDAQVPIQEESSASTFDFQPSTALPSVPPLRRPVVAPLSEEHYKVQVTFSRVAHEKLRRAQALLRHQLPSGDLATVLERGLDALLLELMKTKAGAVARPQDARTVSDVSRRIPASVKRKVWARDGGQCAFKAADGHRCSEKGLLEYHHVVPYASGGKTTVENLELRCRPHNGYEAELFYGERMRLFAKDSAPVYR